MLEMLQHVAFNKTVHLFGVINGVLCLKTKVKGLDILSTDFIPPCRRTESHPLSLLGRITTQAVSAVFRVVYHTHSLSHIAMCAKPIYSQTNQCQRPLRRLQELGRRLLLKETGLSRRAGLMAATFGQEM